MNIFCGSLKSHTLGWLFATFLALVLAGCGGSGTSVAPGTLGVSLTDAPACGFDQVNVTVVKVRVHQSSNASVNTAGWTDITLAQPQKLNLLDLNNGILEELGTATLPAGHYTQLRLVLDPNTANDVTNSVKPTGGSETALVTPSAVQSGIKLVNEFDVPSGQRVDLVLDFNACKSIVKRGNGSYGLKPVISVLPKLVSGIDGFVDTALLGSNVMVSAQQAGVVIRSTAPNVVTGAFVLGNLPSGNYDIVVTADDHASAVIANVPVTSSMVRISTVAEPISLPTSATHTVSGTAVLNPDSTTEVAYVDAKQAVGSSMVTIKSVAADDTYGGAYSLTLPVGAPMLGDYSTTLPIVMTAQTSFAGVYSVEASANGYQTSNSAIVDLSVGDTVQDFTLTP
jgi:hypothetical protein